MPIVNNLLTNRGGCVCIVDYRHYTLKVDYPATVKNDYQNIADVVVKKIQKVGNCSRMFFFGHSFGSRMAVYVGKNGAGGKIPKMDLCEPAGQEFDGTSLALDPKTGGLDVQCIHTSIGFGTSTYNCHQDWRMGPFCGWTQNFDLGASHNLCNDFYNSAFTNKFSPNSNFRNFLCFSSRAVSITSTACVGAKMGYFRTYDTQNCRGDFFAAAKTTAPFV